MLCRNVSCSCRFNFSDFEVQWGKPKKYHVHWDQRLGEGAFGEVFLATNVKTLKNVVVKTIKPEKVSCWMPCAIGGTGLVTIVCIRVA